MIGLKIRKVPFPRVYDDFRLSDELSYGTGIGLPLAYQEAALAASDLGQTAAALGVAPAVIRRHDWGVRWHGRHLPH